MKNPGKFLIVALSAILMLNSCKKDPLLFVSDFITYMDEHPQEGKVIGKVTAGSSEGQITFTITESVPADVLSINAETGVLTVADASEFDYEVNELIEAEVNAVCDGVTKSINVKIYLNDIELITGNNSTIGFSEPATMTVNYLLGRRYKVESPGTLMSLNLIGRNTGASVKMALYSDNNGAPGTLIAKTFAGSVNSWSVITLKVDGSVELEAGYYWIMAVYNSTAGHTYKTPSDAPGLVYFTPLTYANDPPASASGFVSYSGADFTYFMVVD